MTAPARLFMIPVNECAFQARRAEESQTTRLPMLQLAIAAIHAHMSGSPRRVIVVASQTSRATADYLWRALDRGRIDDLVFSTANIEHGCAMDIATHHGIGRWHDVFFCQDMDVEILSPRLITGVEELLARRRADFFFDSLTPVMRYGRQMVPRRPLCCVCAGSCARRVRLPVTLEHMQGEITGRDPSPLKLHRMWNRCARALGQGGLLPWRRSDGPREFHTDTGYAFMQLAPLWGMRFRPLPDELRACYVHRGYLSPRYGLSDVAPDGRTIREHLDRLSARLRDVYGEEPERPDADGCRPFRAARAPGVPVSA